MALLLSTTKKPLLRQKYFKTPNDDHVLFSSNRARQGKSLAEKTSGKENAYHTVYVLLFNKTQDNLVYGKLITTNPAMTEKFVAFAEQIEDGNMAL